MDIWDDFATMVSQSFRYLETEFGFGRVSQQEPFIEYESPIVKVRIFLEPYAGRHELDLHVEEVGDSQKKRPSLGIDTLIELREPAAQRKYIHPAYNHKALGIAVQELAELLKRYGSDILRGDIEMLAQLHRSAIQRFRTMYPTH